MLLLIEVDEEEAVLPKQRMKITESTVHQIQPDTVFYIIIILIEGISGVIRWVYVGYI